MRILYRKIDHFMKCIIIYRVTKKGGRRSLTVERRGTTRRISWNVFHRFYVKKGE
ncbi:unnamed protein product [Acanthoscelides obtectus]|uniref:Uncharacterized protein n=1 Tax=Acanthoscelides obtectus TaxID=200917 RepID=A0A9P0PA48_ACAOB|nr:unnamed protein product [Acanthoscelides obtectus]CAK1630672.1 hypothetical protein AOBTE_LOCUS6480 [Acanthoscelides obtectus]